MNAWVENTLYAPIDNEPLALAAALRAAADQLSYKLPFEDDGRVDVSDLLAIATELEGFND
jgi:hypothetical protein